MAKNVKKEKSFVHILQKQKNNIDICYKKQVNIQLVSLYILLKKEEKCYELVKKLTNLK